MKVLVLGASGYIGLPVATALARHGHEVAGAFRDPKKEVFLISQEIVPLLAWQSVAQRFDIIIDCTNGGNDIATQNLAIAAKASKSKGHHKTTYIYTSATWVHGSADSRDGSMADERSPIQSSGDPVPWRVHMEDLVLSSPDVNGIVIRPAIVYGRTMGLLHDLFLGASIGKIECPASPEGRYALVHQDDLADLYVRVAEAAPICKGLTIDASNPQSEAADDIVRALGKASECEARTYRTPATPLEISMATVAITKPSLARALVGWVPKKMGLVDGMELHWMTWSVLQELGRPT